MRTRLTVSVSRVNYLAVHNADPKPLIWTATAESILAKVRRGRVALQQVVSQ
ncbi:MAG: IS630 family transposase, partial [Gemmatimonas sp.]|nr:IS630 family transposase [Gemmatimonas sp.]